MPEMKTCTRCNVALPLDAFPTRKPRSDSEGIRVHSQCRPCKGAAQTEKNREAARERANAPERLCSKCCVMRPREAFASARTWVCESCQSAPKEVPLESKEEEKARLARRAAQRKERLVETRGGRCMDCLAKPGDVWPVDVFGFYPRGVAKPAPLKLRASKSWKELATEVQQCDVRCMNCQCKRVTEKEATNGR